jgi:hypothetical protein
VKDSDPSDCEPGSSTTDTQPPVVLTGVVGVAGVN